MTLPGSQINQTKTNQTNNNISTLDVRPTGNVSGSSPEASPRAGGSRQSGRKARDGSVSPKQQLAAAGAAAGAVAGPTVAAAASAISSQDPSLTSVQSTLLLQPPPSLPIVSSLSSSSLCNQPQQQLDNASSPVNNANLVTPDFNYNVKVEGGNGVNSSEATSGGSIGSLSRSPSQEPVISVVPRESSRESLASSNGSSSAAAVAGSLALSNSRSSTGSGPSRSSGNGAQAGVPSVNSGSESSKEKQKKKTPWYSSLSLSSTYKSRCDDFKRIFKDIPQDERLVVDYSCAIQRDILVHGRLYVSQNYLCFYANIFRWETQVVLPWKEVTAVKKEKTALVIPNAILVNTKNENHFFTSFGARDKTYIMLFRVWQSALIDEPLSSTELLQWVRSCYGDELGLTSDDEDYINMNTDDSLRDRSLQSYSEESLSVSVSEGGDNQANGSALKGRTTSTSGQSVHRELHQMEADVIPSVGKENSPGRSATSGGNENGGGPDNSMNADIDQSSPDHPSSLSPQPEHQQASPPGTESPFQFVVLQSIPGNDQQDQQGHFSPLPSSTLPQRSPSDLLPTDISDDSSLSESESDRQCEIVICPMKHEGKLMLHMQVAMHVDQLFTHLFTNSKFFSDLHEMRKTTDMKHSPWVMNPSTNQKGRTVSLTVSLTQSVGPKQAQVTESQKMLPCSKPGEMYAIEIETSNAGVPYADSFYIARHYCLTRGADPNTSMIAVYCQIKYRKSVWNIVKTFIEKNCWTGLEDYYSTLVKALEEECQRTRIAVVSGTAVAGAISSRRGPKRRNGKEAKVGLAGVSGTDIDGDNLVTNPAGGISGRISIVSEVLPPPIPPPFPPVVRHIPYPPSLLVPAGPGSALPLHRGIIQAQNSAGSTASAGGPTAGPDPITWMVFITLLVLLVINAALYYKLWGLEQAHADLLAQRATHHHHHHTLDNLDLVSPLDKGTSWPPQTDSDWRNLLNRQQQLHSAQLDRWATVLKAAVHLLQQVEKSLTALQSSIQGVVSDEMFRNSASSPTTNDEL